MKREALEFRIGLFVTAGMVLLLAMVVAFGQLQLLRRDYQVIGEFTGSVGSVTPGAPVRLAGVDIGKASEIKVDKRGNVRAFLRVYEEVTIKSDAHLVIKQDGILGEHYFEFTGGTDAAPELPKTGKGVISGVVQTSMGDIPPKVTELLTRYEPKLALILENLNKSIVGLNTIIADQKTQESFRATVQYASATIAKGPALAEKLEGAVTEATAAIKGARIFIDRLNGTVDAVNGVMASAKAQLGELGKHYTALAADLRGISSKMENLLNAMSRLAGQARETSTVGRMLSEDKLYQKLVEALDEARTTLAQVKETFRYLEENPTALYWGDKDKKKVTEDKPFWQRIFGVTPTTAQDQTKDESAKKNNGTAPPETKSNNVPPQPARDGVKGQ